MKDVIDDFTLITTAGFHLEGAIRQIKNKQTKISRFLQLKNPSILLSKISCHLGFLSLKERAEVDGFPWLVRRYISNGQCEGKHEDNSGN